VIKLAKLLLVEDEIYIFKIEEQILKKASHNVVWTDASEKAWEYLENGYPDGEQYNLAIIDIVYIRKVPHGPTFKDEGLKLTRRIRHDDRFKHLPILGTTLFLPEDDNESWKEKFIKNGGDEFLEQYIDPEEFVQIIDKLLHNKNQ